MTQLLTSKEPFALKPLCRCYALMLVNPLIIEFGTSAASTVRRRWRWALGMLADGASEAMGAWPATASQDALLRERLREMGAERIDALLGNETLARLMGIPVATQPLTSSALVAVDTAARLHAKIERAISRAAPFADLDAAFACVGAVFDKAELAKTAHRRCGLPEPSRARRLRTFTSALGV